MISRRSVLKGGLSVAAAAAIPKKNLALRGDNARGRDLSPTPASLLDAEQREALAVLGRSELRHPGSLPFPHQPAGTDMLEGIDHIVMLMMENHSWDNIFGMLEKGDGFTLGSDGLPTASNPYPDGRIQHAFHMPSTCQLSGGPSQEWRASHRAYNNGKMDGFVRAIIDPSHPVEDWGVAMGYFDTNDLPFTYSLATNFAICDRWFCSLLGQTQPNRRFLIAGTSAGNTDDVTTNKTAANIANFTIDLPHGTIFDSLTKHKISWINYSATLGLPGATPDLYYANDHQLLTPKHLKHLDVFFEDARGGKLPQFTFVDPTYDVTSQENPQNVARGEGLIARVVEALGKSPVWKSTLLILNYDEHGGYYDHVAPPAALAPDDFEPIIYDGESKYTGFRRYGIRVPAVVISPYAKPGYVSHVVYDHTSVLALIERKWNLPAMTYRDANANDVLDCLDLNALENKEPTFPTLPNLAKPGNTPARLACDVTGPGTIPPPRSIT